MIRSSPPLADKLVDCKSNSDCVMEGRERVGIPSSLNPIRTRPAAPGPDEQSSSGGDDSPATPNCPLPNWDYGFPRGGKIAGWFNSYFSPRSSDKTNQCFQSTSEANRLGIKHQSDGKNIHKKGFKGKQSSTGSQSQIPYTYSPLKSFSCELGSKTGSKTGIQPQPMLQTRSFCDLKVLFASFNSKFDEAKEMMNLDLVNFSKDLKDAIENGLLSEEQNAAHKLLNLSRECIQMTPCEFREKCEKIVCDLAESRHQSGSSLLKEFEMHLLFALTRCTRLLHYGEENWKVGEEPYEKFKKCLESVPSYEMKWVPSPDVEASVCSTDSLATEEETKNISSSAAQKDQKLLQDLLIDSSRNLTKEQNISLDELAQHTVMCRICEESIPTSHLESHSYVCAYANECDLEFLTIDERLHKIADMLEQIVESCSQSFEQLCGQSADSSVKSGHESPQVQEWRNKGTEGMFEDIHELDTARIDELNIGASNSLKSLLSMKLGGEDSNAGSSNCSLTSASSNNTPRSSYFDLFWIEHHNPSDQEDINQVNRMAGVTRSVANLDCKSENAPATLLVCLNELLHILQQNQIKALVIDTFGCRIKNLLKKKYLHVTQALGKRCYKIPVQPEEVREEGYLCLNSSSEFNDVHDSVPLENERVSIDDFEKIKQISRGAFGKVFLARKRTTGDLFAIKVLKKLHMIRKNDVQRILAERDILITVRNPFVVRFFYSFTCRENLYLVMEYLNGGDLYSLLRTVGCLDEKIARIYVAELVLALEYLHSLRIIHRDLKPDNILIAGDGHIKLTDFGLSKIGLIANSINMSESKMAKKRRRCSAVGTPDYLAPEILLGTEHGYAADWWSVGIILFELITGIPPFTARSPEMIFDNILNRRIPWPPVPNDISYEAKDLIERLLAPDQYLRLGANGASEVKAHPFFNEVNWDSLAWEKAAFVPCPETVEDTSYFLPRHPQSSYENLKSTSNGKKSNSSSNHATATSTTASSTANLDKEEHYEEEDIDSGAYVDISSINFSFKNLAQLASMNYDVLRQSGKVSRSSIP